MDNAIEFRRQMRGYNKEDVNRYISEENIRFNRIEENYTKTINEKDSEIFQLKNIAANLDSLKAENAQLADTNNALSADITNLKKMCEEKDSIIEGLKSAVATANERIKALEVESISTNIPSKVQKPEYNYDYNDNYELAEKAMKYDAICGHINEILDYARAEAENIIGEATQIKLQTEKRAMAEAATFKNSIQQQSDSIIEDLKKSIRRQLKTTRK